ncbi:MAG: ATP-binding cassette domain-containing protein [Pseudonocardia sp.]|nr:ATP-binding cassette domain-containing protein [Pseudonocardia sp.]
MSALRPVSGKYGYGHTSHSLVGFVRPPGYRRAVSEDGFNSGSENGAVLVKARGLSKRFGPLEAVRGIDLDVIRGEVFGLLGPNGAGKSSAMRMLACVSPRSAGSLHVLGMDPDVDGPAIRARIGVVPQLDNLDVDLSVRENLQIYGRYFGLSRARARQRAAELLRFAQLADRADSQVESLSGGMRRRLIVARSLVNDPELLLLDEPTTGLDPQARHQLWDRLYQLKQHGVTQLITTHYMDEAERLCDRLVVMDAGVIAAEGSPAALIKRYSTRDVLELRFASQVSRPTPTELAGFVERVEELPDRLLLYADDGEAALGALHRAGVRPRASLVRRSSLEDVFLRLTGRSLVE